jgi:hypothetical protein
MPPECVPPNNDKAPYPQRNRIWYTESAALPLFLRRASHNWLGLIHQRIRSATPAHFRMTGPWHCLSQLASASLPRTL